MKKGETILISDGEDREYVCTIDELENEQVRAKNRRRKWSGKGTSN